MGNRNQLQWDLPALDSFELNRAIYRSRGRTSSSLRDELIELLDVGDLVRKPVRQLSLGERMKVEIVGALLHQPQVLFLDEPTIGLDVTMQKRIRSFVAEYNQRHGATVLLTSHYMADVAGAVQARDRHPPRPDPVRRALTGLADQFAAYKTIGVALENGQRPLEAYGEVIHRDGDWVTLRVPKAETSRVAARLLADQSVLDLTIEDPPIEDVIELVFAQEQPRNEHVGRSRARSARPGRVRSMVDFYLTTMRTAVQQQFQYRTANYFYMLGMVAEPVIYLVVWTTIADQQGGSVQGLTAGYFAAYYIVWTLVRNMNIVFGAPFWEERIREGELNRDLLRPLLRSTTTSPSSRAGRSW